MPKSNRAYKSAKRNKELDRQRKREEKKRRRLAAKSGVLPEEGEAPVEATEEEIVPDEDPDPIIPRD
ncbi:MAG: hypothetical protein NTW38_03405 [Candidatus Aminicenantes bacterium]|nr:hypothetical protein [Candidatus Aminicenantes bacterium]